MASLHKLQENEVMTDVTLILPDQSAIQCHKVVLMAASPFFETMFQSGLKEAAEHDIKLDFADSGTIRSLVEFFYTGDIKLTAENVKTIVAASEFLCCKHLKAHCEEFLTGNVGLSNCIDYYQFGKVFNLKVLIKTAFNFILFKFREFMEISDFDKLTEDELSEVVSCDRLNAENEDVVFEAVVHWVNGDLDAREEVFPRIAPLIRFPFCTQTMLSDKICCSSLVLKSECIQLALEAVWSQFHLNCRPPIDNARCIPRQSFLLGGSTPSLILITESTSQKKVFLSVTSCIDGSQMKWETIMPCKTAKFDRSLAFIDGKIFAFGGDPASKSVKSINLKESNPEWKSEQEMLHEVLNPLIVQFANKVYAFDSWITMVTQEFDPALKEWRMRSEIPGDCFGGSAVALGDKIYVVGGYQRVCFSYDPKNDEWQVLSEQTHQYYRNVTATVWKGKILLGNTKHMEEYDPVEDRWSNRDELLPGGRINKICLHASCSL
ncbi:hypothetical protein CAPTEDRAFT_98406 [Capitella teleta]|uniref:BTB domain-containing protein n=1 Tax=Capitella teleta TaxID=283909 RepID=R7V5C2_CAPTE|nr:hypothetical protein CAPTEDRAFT_98406 [Capitella teleta]|eukprot:ELU13739.1 hypothetical protein CAPTEDRAFT_98406 [Capitella teleta]